MTEAEASGGPVQVTMKAREHTVKTLGMHFARDHIGLAELEERVDRAYAARSHEELRFLLSDLPALPELRGAEPPDSTGSYDGQPTEATRKREVILGIMGGFSRRGRWTPRPRLLSVALMGGVVLDFREATFAASEVEVTVLSLMGGTEILVPPDLRVEVGGVPIMGAFEHSSEGTSPRPDAPVLRVKGLALMGGVEVKVLAPDEPYEPDW